ncbi:MAG: hypothetical protein P8M20_02605 [Planctomycetaceae bacterium]|jgi:hypothetical protein|nr:hypothetical protein [Planctomycetaceae bacterium]
MDQHCRWNAQSLAFLSRGSSKHFSGQQPVDESTRPALVAENIRHTHALTFSTLAAAELVAVCAPQGSRSKVEFNAGLKPLSINITV